MTHVPVETLLTGGNVNQVVKVGDTVRRLRGPHSKTVHEFLHHLETTCVQIPKLLGILRQTSGRDLISLIKTHLISNFGETAILAILTHAEAAAVVSRMWWKLSSGVLRACRFGPDQAARSRLIGAIG